MTTPDRTSDAADNDASASKSSSLRASLASLPWFGPDTKEIWRERGIVLLVLAAVFLPLLGSFGLWDPWETHYGEVGRQITERNDWISTWWGSHWEGAGGSVEGGYFFSKPILLMWMMAIGVEIFGVNPLGIRLGVALVAMLGSLLVYMMGVSVFNRRVGLMMAGVLTTSPFWFFLGRQAQTDMPFVGLMTVGMCFFLMGAFGQDRKLKADKFSYVLTLGWFSAIVIPQISLVLVGLSRWRGGSSRVMDVIAGRPMNSVIVGGVLLGISAILLGLALWKGKDQKLRRRLAVLSLSVTWVPLLILLPVVLIAGSNVGNSFGGWFVWGPTQAAIYATCLGGVIYWTLTNPKLERGSLYLLSFYVFIGLATLAKGLLGFMLPGAIFFFYILISRDWSLLRRIELGRGILIFIAVSFPWYAAMLIRHNPGFWQRFFVHDHFKRLASGVHQISEGSFEHFIRWLSYGLFPWVAFIPAALGRLFGGKGLSQEDDRSRATLILVLWAVLAFTLFTLSSTKFHHYVFPVVPALAMLIALALDDLLDRDRMAEPWPLYLAGVGILGVVAWDLVDDPQMFKNLFTYQYDREWDHASWDRGLSRWTLNLVIPGLIGSVLLLFRGERLRKTGLIMLFVTGFSLAVFGLNIYMPTISPTFSQQYLWDRYYELCTKTEGPPGSDSRKHFCEEPAISYKLNWRGETYHTANEVIPIRNDADYTKFLEQVGDGTYYGIMDKNRYRGDFQRKLPARYKDRACVVHNENMKFVLAKVPCEADDPARVDLDQAQSGTK